MNQGPKDAIFDPKRAIVTPHDQLTQELLFSKSTWDIGTKNYHFYT